MDQEIQALREAAVRKTNELIQRMRAKQNPIEILNQPRWTGEGDAATPGVAGGSHQISDASKINAADTFENLASSGVISFNPVNSATVDLGGSGNITMASAVGTSNTNNTNTASAAAEVPKVRRKVFVPTDSNENYIGLLIGPKGSNQKRMEEQSGCKILIRGRGSQKDGTQGQQQDEDEDQHVLIVGDDDSSAERAVELVKNILFADPQKRNSIRQEQLRIYNEQKHGAEGGPVGGIPTRSGGPGDDSATPDGHVNDTLAVPGDCIGLIIGKSGETIKSLQAEAKVKIYVTNDPVEDGKRMVAFEGPRENVDYGKTLVNNVVEDHFRRQREREGQRDPFRGNRYSDASDPKMTVYHFTLPATVVGLIIGKGGETIKSLSNSARADIVIPKEGEYGSQDRKCEIHGNPNQIYDAREGIIKVLRSAHKPHDLSDVMVDGKVFEPYPSILRQPQPDPFVRPGGGGGGPGDRGYGGGRDFRDRDRDRDHMRDRDRDHREYRDDRSGGYHGGHSGGHSGGHGGGHGGGSHGGSNWNNGYSGGGVTEPQDYNSHGSGGNDQEMMNQYQNPYLQAQNMMSMMMNGNFNYMNQFGMGDGSGVQGGATDAAGDGTNGQEGANGQMAGYYGYYGQQGGNGDADPNAAAAAVGGANWNNGAAGNPNGGGNQGEDAAK